MRNIEGTEQARNPSSLVLFYLKRIAFQSASADAAIDAMACEITPQLLRNTA